MSVFQGLPGATSLYKLKSAMSESSATVQAMSWKDDFECNPLSSFAMGDYDQEFPPTGDALRVVINDGAFGYCMQVNVNVVIMSVIAVDVQEHNAKLVLEVSAHWLVPAAQADTHRAFYEQFKPDMVFENFAEEGSRSNIFEDCEVQSRDLRIQASSDAGKSVSRVRAFQVKTEQTVELQQHYHLECFPFDLQAIEVRLRSRPLMIWGRRFDTELCHPERLIMDQKKGNYVAENADMLSDYEIEELLCFRVMSKESRLIDTYSANILLSRNPNSIMFNIVVPSFMVLALSITAFWVNPCNFEGRSSITLTLVLTQAASMQYVHDQLPPVPYLTPVEILSLGSTILLFIHAFMQLSTKARCIPKDSNSIFDIDLGINDPDVFDDADDDAAETVTPKYSKTQKMIDRFGIHLTWWMALFFICAFTVLWMFRKLFLVHFRALHRKTKFYSVDAVRRANALDDKATKFVVSRRNGHSSASPMSARIRTTTTGFLAATAMSIMGFSSSRRLASKLTEEEDDHFGSVSQQLQKLQNLRFDLYRLLLDRRDGSSAYRNDVKEDLYHGFFHERINKLFVSAKRHASGGTGAGAASDSESSSDMREYQTALIFDCGTGTTKAIVCLMTPDGDVQVMEPEGCEVKVSIQDIMKDDDEEQASEEDPDARKLSNEFADATRAQVTAADESSDAVLERAIQDACADIEFDTAMPLGSQLGGDQARTLRNLLHAEGITSAEDLRTALQDPALRHILICQKGSDLPTGLWLRVDEELEQICGLGKLMKMVQWMENVKLRLMKNKLVSKTGAIIPKGHVHVMIGLTAWYRKLDTNPNFKDTHRAIQSALESLHARNEDWAIERLTELDECWYEMKSVLHAWNEWTSNNDLEAPVDLEPLLRTFRGGAPESDHAARPAAGREETKSTEPLLPPLIIQDVQGSRRAPPVLSQVHGILAVGQGSTQLTTRTSHRRITDRFYIDERDLEQERNGADASSSIETGSEDGPLAPYMLGMGVKEGAFMLKPLLKAWYQRKRHGPELADEVRAVRNEWLEACRSRVSMWKNTQGMAELGDDELLIAISASWYGLQDALKGLMKLPSPTPPIVAAQLAHLFELKMQKILTALETGCTLKPENEEKEVKSIANALSNLTYLKVLLANFCSPGTQVRVARDWNLPASEYGTKSVVQYRTTWTSGWFLDRFH